jgi:3-dehydroquinate synthase
VIWRLDLPDLSRPSLIVGGVGALDLLTEHARSLADAGRRVFIVSDTTVWKELGGQLTVRLEDAMGDAPFLIAAGEMSKSVSEAARCWDRLAAAGARRDDVVVAAGGGVVGDLAGFVAATYLRGLGLWQIPTTLLAQVDSSVGGKVAVNLAAGKNLVGSFYQPDLVVADPCLLATLPEPEFRSGMGEVVKYALLDAGGLLEHLECDVAPVLARRADVVGAIVERCVGVKAAVVSDDETERGRRAVLNLGHTAAHALEATLGYGVLPHGVAVGLGLLVALAVSEEMVGLSPTVRDRTRRLLVALGLPVVTPVASWDEVVEAAGRDKKVTAAGSGFVCLRAVGEPSWGVPVPADVFRRGLEVIRP